MTAIIDEMVKIENSGFAPVLIAVIVVIIVVSVSVTVVLVAVSSGGGGGGSFGNAVITGLYDAEGNLITNGGTTGQRIQRISGTVENPDAGNTQEFAGTVYLVFNGQEEEIPVSYVSDEWIFYETRVLTRGANTFRIIVRDLQGNTAAQSDVFTVYADIPPMDIWIQLTWNTDYNDVDLHVWDPDMNHCYYGNKSGIPGAELDVDDVNGYGPEHFTMQSARAGNYIVKVRYYSANGVQENTEATVRIRIAEGTERVFRHTFGYEDQTIETSFETTYGYDWVVATLSMDGSGGGTIS
ncbi:MAG: hypothetical protein QXG10_01475 [Candidatus Hadarchaeales archaeon]